MIVKQVSLDIVVADANWDMEGLIKEHLEARGYEVLGTSQEDISHLYKETEMRKDIIRLYEVWQIGTNDDEWLLASSKVFDVEVNSTFSGQSVKGKTILGTWVQDVFVVTLEDGGTKVLQGEELQKLVDMM